MTVYSAPYTFSLASAGFASQSGYRDASGIVAANGWTRAFVTYYDLVLDPATSYTFEFDIASYDPAAVYPDVTLLSMLTSGTVNDAFNTSSEFYLGDTYPATADGSAVTLPLTIGPGLQDYDSAMTAGERRVFVRLPSGIKLTGMRLTAGTSAAVTVDPPGDISAGSAPSGGGGGTTTYPGPWMGDATTTQLSVIDGDSAGLTAGTAIRWLSTSLTDDRPPSELMQEAWNGAGEPVTSGATGQICGVEIASRSPDAGGGANASWSQTWALTGPIGSNNVAGTTAPSSSDPHVVGIEWEPTTTPESYVLHLELYNLTTPATMPGNGFQVHATAGGDPGFMPASSLNNWASIGSGTLPAAASGSAAFDFPVPGPLGSSAVTVVDPFTVAGVTPDVICRFEFRFTQYGVYRPRYRYLYDVPQTPITHAPPLRQYPRSDGLGASSARRVWPPSKSIQRSNRRVGGYL